MTVSLLELSAEWREHPLGKSRAEGGVNALRGFSFQLALSLEHFLDMADASNPNIEVAFEGLGDLTTVENGLVYLVQMKSTLTTATAKAAAREALVVDAFLEASHPELRELFVYETRCGRHDSGDPRTLTPTQLGLTGGDRKRWLDLRGRMKEPTVRSSPYLGLVARLYGVVDDPFGVASAMIGELTLRLGRGEEPTRVGEAILALLSRARSARAIDPPGSVLTVESFEPRPDGSRILLGQRPTIDHLTRGYFMPRPTRAASGATHVLEVLRRERNAADQPVPVCWLSGASGAGKSVLLLQILELLTADGRLIVHNLPPSNAALEDTLTYWRTAKGEVVVAIDDLYAPARRSEEQWDRLTGIALDPRRATRLTILTTGSDDYLRAFEQVAGRTGAFVVEELDVPSLESHEQAAFHSWLKDRTGARVTASRHESVFVVAAFLATLGSEAGESMREFAERFSARAEATGLGPALRAALAMNQLGLPAPERLFGDDLDDLTQLIDEEVVQRESLNGVGVITVFHQLLAKELYEALVPEARVNQRARDLEMAFEACATNVSLAASLLETLHRRARRAECDRQVLERVLAATWEPMWESDPDGSRLPVVAAWLFAARGIGFPLNVAPYERQLLSWAAATHTSGQLVRPVSIVLRDALPLRRAELVRSLHGWLSDNPTDPEWPTVCILGLPDHDVIDLAERWLDEHTDAWGSVDLFVAIAPYREHIASDWLARILQEAPTTTKDPRLWRLARDLGYETDPLLATIAHRACSAPTRRVIRRAVKQIVEHAATTGAKAVEAALMDNLDAAGLPRFLRVLAVEAPPRTPLAEAAGDVGLAWLQSHLDAPEWQPTWHAVFTRRTPRTLQHIAAIARTWLTEHPEARGWPSVASTLALRFPHGMNERDIELFTGDSAADTKLYESATSWLAENTQHPRWPNLFSLVNRHCETPQLRSLADEWLTANPSETQWRLAWRPVGSEIRP